jgi:hypothetical protein
VSDEIDRPAQPAARQAAGDPFGDRIELEAAVHRLRLPEAGQVECHHAP